MLGVTHLRGNTWVHNTMLQEAPLMPVQKRCRLYASYTDSIRKSSDGAISLLSPTNSLMHAAIQPASTTPRNCCNSLL